MNKLESDRVHFSLRWIFRSLDAKFNEMPLFSGNVPLGISETTVVKGRRKKRSIALELLFRQGSTKIALCEQIRLWRPRMVKVTIFWRIPFLAYNFWTKISRETIERHRVSPVEAHRNMHVDVEKVQVKIWPQVNITWGHVVTEVGHIAY